MDTTIHINVADIPPEVGESFGRVTLAGFKKFIAQPGNREKLEAQTAARKGSAINNIASVIYGTPEHGQPIAGNAVILREGFVAGERDFVGLTEDDETGLILMLFALGISIKDESEAE